MDKLDNKFVTLVLLFFLVFGFFTVSVISRQALKIQASKNIVPSAQSSILLAFPLSTPVNTQATVNCVARDSDGNAAQNKTCVISASCGTIMPASVQTNANGIAQFFVKSDVPCTAQISAVIDGNIQVSQTTSVQFTAQ